MKTTTLLAKRRFSFLVILFLLSTAMLTAQVKIKSRVEIKPKAVLSKSVMQTEVLDTMVIYVMPFNGKAWLQVESYYIFQGDTKLTLNGQIIYEDMWYVDWSNYMVDLGFFAQGENLVFKLIHGYGDDANLAGKAWHVGTCSIDDATNNSCVGFQPMEFSDVQPFCNQDFGGHEPMNVQVTLHTNNESTAAGLTEDWNGSTYNFEDVFRERAPIVLNAQNKGVICGDDVPLPQGTTFSFTITEGQKYALLRDPVFERKDTVLDLIAQNNGGASVELYIAGDTLTQPEYVTVEVKTTASNASTLVGRIEIDPGTLKVKSTKSVIVYGDTLRIDTRSEEPDGSLYSFPEGTKYFYEILEGNDAGVLYSPDSSEVGDVLLGDYTTANFAAIEETPQANSTEVIVRAVAIEPYDGGGGGETTSIIVKSKPGEGTATINKSISKSDQALVGKETEGISSDVNNNQTGKQTLSKSFRKLAKELKEKPALTILQKNVYGGYSAERMKQKQSKTESSIASTPAPRGGFGPIGHVIFNVVKPDTILLGESKYYYATEKDGKLTIHEAVSPQTPQQAIQLPQEEGVISTDIWGDNPVTAITDKPNSGNQIGVYWEKKYPMFSGNTFTEMWELPDGMIRLVGRFWHKDSTYIIKLATTRGNASLAIEVKKPARLGNSQYAIDRRLSRDVFDHPIDIDSICIFYGGLYGVPPQLIKGQMEKESRYVNNFGFSPAYRYEPYTAQFWDEVRNRRNNPFFIQNSICTPEPPNHLHVRDINYFTEVQSVWNVIINHSQLINDIPDDSHRLYGIRTYSDTMNFEPYERPMNIYHAFLSHYLDELGLEIQEAADSARSKMIVYLRDEWDYHVPRNNKGLMNVTAQTRIASSYGLLQPMYTKALLFGYQENNNYLPELLNITDTTMVVAMRYQKEKLRMSVGASEEANNNSWTNGYENGFFRGVYSRWNSKPNYPTVVFRNSRNYQPQKE
ncbi:MAG: hypothetical protein ABR936_14330 [Bacteroidota bacterium]